MRSELTAVGLVLVLLASGAAAVSSDGSEGGTIGVTIGEYCEVDIERLEPPGFNGVLASGKSGPFNFTVENAGSIDADISTSLNITFEGEDPWEPGEPWGEVAEGIDPFANYSYPDVTNQTVFNETTGAIVESINRSGMHNITPTIQGYYTGHLTVNATCQTNGTTRRDSETDYATLLVISNPGGEGGSKVGEQETDDTVPATDDTNATVQQNRSVDETSGTIPANVNATQGNITRNVNQTEGNTPAESNATRGNIPQDVNNTDGNITRQANQTAGNVPANVNDRDGQLDRNSEQDGETFPQDAQQVGEQSDITEGNAPTPGQTPTPQPEPIPVLSVEMQPWNDTYRTAREQFANIKLRVSNTANQTLSGIELRPRLGNLAGNWTGRPTTLGNLSQGAAVNRSVYVRPGAGVEPGYYAFPVVAYAPDGRAIAAEYVDIRVRQEIFQAQMEIAEAPSTVTIDRNGTTTIPILIRNTGRSRLQNVTARLQEVDGLGSIRATSIRQVEINGTAGLRVQFNATAADFETANATLVVSSADGAYSFANVRIAPSRQQRDGVVPEQFRMPIVATIWTILLVLYALLTKFYDLDSLLVRIPFIMLILGEVTLMLYVASEYYGFSAALLPF